MSTQGVSFHEEESQMKQGKAGRAGGITRFVMKLGLKKGQAEALLFVAAVALIVTAVLAYLGADVGVAPPEPIPEPDLQGRV